MNEKKQLDAEDVSRYLADNPDFLTSHPDALTALNLPHESGEAVSLIERQVGQLRERNEQLTAQLSQLVKVATENEALMVRLHELSLELTSIDDLGDFFDRLSEVLMEEFEADVLNITLFNRKISAGDSTPIYNADPDDPDLQPLRPHLEKGETVCGRLNRSKLDALFRNRAQWVQSTALVPMGEHGIMAIGSSDPARFYPGMGTLFLDLLARVIAHQLEFDPPAEHLRSA